MNSNSIAQIAMFVLSLAIIIAYIKPSLEEVSTIQETVYEYNEIVDKASELNSELNKLVQLQSSFRNSDLNALQTFLPPTVDTLQVMADIDAIASISEVALVSLSGPENSSGDDGSNFSNSGNGEVIVNGEAVTNLNRTRQHNFEMVVAGEYDAFKTFLANVARNKYLLEVTSLSFSGGGQDQGGGDTELSDGQFNLTLTTHTYVYQGLNTQQPGDEFDEFGEIDTLSEDTI